MYLSDFVNENEENVFFGICRERKRIGESHLFFKKCAYVSVV